MNREYRTNRIRHYGRRPPVETSRRRVANGAASPPLATGRDVALYTDRLRGAPAEFGLTLAPPPRYRSVLLPVDGGPFGEHALPLGLGIARRAGAEVRVVHVHCPMRSDYWPETPYYESGVDVYLRRRQETYLNNLCRRLGKFTPVPVTPVFLQGYAVADSLHAAAVGTDLVVMATHGRGPLGRVWFGSVAAQLLRRLPVPVLLVRGDNAPADLTCDPLPRNILIPLDGSALAEEILEPAAALGTLTGARYTLVHVVDPATVPDYGIRDWGGPLDKDLERLPPQATRLRAVAERLAQAGARVNAVVLFDGNPARAILRYARDHGADVIALATGGRRAMARMFRGSIADRVVRGASVPVLAYRPATASEVRETP